MDSLNSMPEKQQMKHHYGMNILRKLTMKKKYIMLIFVLYFVLLSLLLNRQYRILKISELQQSIILPFDDERRNEQPYITQQTVNR